MTVKFSRTTSMKTPTDTISVTREVTPDVNSPGTIMIQDGIVGGPGTKQFDMSFFGNQMTALFISSDGTLQVGINGPFGGENDGEIVVTEDTPYAWLTGDLEGDNPFFLVPVVTSIHVTNPNSENAKLLLRLMAQTWND